MSGPVATTSLPQDPAYTVLGDVASDFTLHLFPVDVAGYLAACRRMALTFLEGEPEYWSTRQSKLSLEGLDGFRV